MFPIEGGWAGTGRNLPAHPRRDSPMPHSRVVFSIADDHFDNPHFRDFYAESPAATAAP